MTVFENLEIGARAGGGRQVSVAIERAFALFPILAERRWQLAGTLSGGEQQMLAIARGLASSPKLMMLDEPSMGLAPAIADGIFEAVDKLHKSGQLTIMLVEQRMADPIEFSDRIYVLQTGEIRHSGRFADLVKDDLVRRAYFGA
jgi:branched-chain amino acid transport system ATP-binding protein